MYIYQTDACDFWAGTVKAKEAVAQQVADSCYGVDVMELFRLAMTAARIVAAAKGSNWQGDIRGDDLYFFGIPDAIQTRIGIAWKQDNNGDTFICSPVRLPWFDDRLLATVPE